MEIRILEFASCLVCTLSTLILLHFCVAEVLCIAFAYRNVIRQQIGTTSCFNGFASSCFNGFAGSHSLANKLNFK